MIEKKLFSCYQLGEKVAVVSQSYTEAGFHVDQPAVKIFPANDLTAIGLAAYEALSQFEDRVAVPDWSKHKWQVPAALKVTQRQLNNQAKHCEFTVEHDQVSVKPSISGGAAGDGKGFSPRKDVAFIAPLPRDARIFGELINKGLSLSLTFAEAATANLQK